MATFLAVFPDRDSTSAGMSRVIPRVASMVGANFTGWAVLRRIPFAPGLVFRKDNQAA